LSDMRPYHHPQRRLLQMPELRNKSWLFLTEIS
jgi:hypothetical protein